MLVFYSIITIKIFILQKSFYTILEFYLLKALLK